MQHTTHPQAAIGIFIVRQQHLSDGCGSTDPGDTDDATCTPGGVCANRSQEQPAAATAAVHGHRRAAAHVLHAVCLEVGA